MEPGSRRVAAWTGSWSLDVWFYDWLQRPPSALEEADVVLIESIWQVHYESRGTYGAPRVHAELRLGMGLRLGRKCVPG